jgi:poly(hydroxyalkanoate) depolymerase family esterase
MMKAMNMNAFSKIDMGEVTRLTRAGKLAEAVALLRGKPTTSSPSANATSEPSHNPRRTKLIDMNAPPVPGGAWTAGPSPVRRAPAATNPAILPPALAQLRARRPTIRKSASLPEGARFEERALANEAGNLSYKIYVPSCFKGEPLPIVLMLHGCTQDPDDFAAGTQMNQLAEEFNFLVAYPRQPQTANMQKCWNWFEPANQRREGGEASLIAGVALQVVEEFAADRARIYVAGLSAGGAAAAILGATYPDLFAAVGVHSGLACGAARDMPSAFAAMGAGGIVRATAGASAPTIVFHGDGDRTVNPVNGDHVIAQARPSAALRETVSHGESNGGVAYTRRVERDGAGRDVLEYWVLHGAGHAWSGGSARGSFTDPLGPDASREMIRFFLSHTNAGGRA